MTVIADFDPAVGWLRQADEPLIRYRAHRPEGGRPNGDRRPAEPDAARYRRWAMKRFTHTVALVALTLTVVACSSGAAASATPGSSTSPSASPSASPSSDPSLRPVAVSSPEEAAARVIEVAPEHMGIGPKDPDLIGGCCFWEATPTADGWDVVFEVGWGDCQSGCIERHRWTYSVTRDGAVELVSESGSPPPSGVPGSGGG